MLAGQDGAIEMRAFAAPATATSGARCGRRSPPTWPRRGGTATEREGRFGTELVCQVPVRRPRRHRHPAVADHRHQRPALAAARHVLRQAGPRARRAPATGRTRSPRSPSVAATTRCRSASRCRSTLPDQARRVDQPSPEPMAEQEPAAAHHQRLGRASDQDEHARDLRRTHARPDGRVGRSRTRPTASWSGCAARCAPSRCGRAAACRPWRPSSTTAPACSPSSGSAAAGSPASGPVGRCRCRAGSACTTGTRIIYNPRYELIP